jgi:3-oxoacyl-ACP reductase-like protein
MSLFDTIKNAIFAHSAPAASTPPQGGPAQPSAQPSAAAPVQQVQQPVVDVEAILNGLAAKNPQKLNWQTSIVDLMKLLGLDSSLQNRQALAKELGYSGDTADSATMNTWLHAQVMRKLAESGGKVPASLRG